MLNFRTTALVQFELPSSATEESLPLTTEREFGVFLRVEGQALPAQSFRSPINDEQWRTFVRRLRECNVNHDESGYRGAQAIRAVGRALYESLAGLSPKLREFLDEAGQPRRLVIQTRRPELHVLPWGALYDLEGRLLAAGDLSIVQCWEGFSETPLTTGGSLNLLRVLGAETNRTTALSLKGLPPEITTDARGAADILHVEEHGNAVLGEIGGVSAPAMARTYARAKLALLWSCYSAATNSWGESPALCLHRMGAGLVLSFQAELNYLDAKSISEAFYAEVFGPAASRDPETALVRIRVAKFEKEFESANWASMTVYLRCPLDLSAMALNGPRVPASGWLAESGGPTGGDGWPGLAAAVGRLQPGSVTGMAAPYGSRAGELVKLPLLAMKAWRGNVIRLHGAADPLPDSVIKELNLAVKDAPKTDVADKLAWFFERIAGYGSPLIVWTEAAERHVEFLKAIRVSSSLTFLLLYGEEKAGSVAELVDLNLLEKAQAAIEGSREDQLGEEELSAAYFAFARCEKPEKAGEYLRRMQSAQERLLLSGNFVSRFGVVPGVADAEAGQRVEDLERRYCEEDFYREAMEMKGEKASLRETGRAKHELGYLMQCQGRVGTAEIFYRLALEDLERSAERGTRWHSALGRLLRDWADLLADDVSRLVEAERLLRRALAIHTFHGRRLEVAYSLTTSARIALTGCRHTSAIADAVDAANRFEECGNWRGWSTAVKILLDGLAETRETGRMLSLIELAMEKIAGSNLKAGQRLAAERMLRVQGARGRWIAGDVAGARQLLAQVFEGAPAEFGETGPGREAERLRRFLAVSGDGRAGL